MSMHWIDWLIVLGSIMLFTGIALYSRRYTRSVADFLAANRCAGRYLLTISEGITALGAITIVAMWQKKYHVGFAVNWWGTYALPLHLVLMMTGFVAYRLRETRALTVAQFFEMRYSKRFRIFAGSICFVSGMLNFGIFPAVTTNFFMQFCQIPELWATDRFLGLPIPFSATFALLSGGMCLLALCFTFWGGQIGVLITDFFQGLMTNFLLLGLTVVILVMFGLTDIFDTLEMAPDGLSMLNPFDIGRNVAFDHWYFIIGLLGVVYQRKIWLGQQAYQFSAKSPHEAKMAGIVSSFRQWAFLGSLALVPLVAYMIMHHPEYADQKAAVEAQLATISNVQDRDQMVTPLTLTTYLPLGCMGFFAAVMFAAFITTQDSYLHSWGSILVQDVILPARKKPLEPERHMKWLRWTIVGVALFNFCYSLFFQQIEAIALYFMVTGAIYMGGAGMVVIGGLYTRWGSTLAAWACMIVGSLTAIGGIVYARVDHWPAWVAWTFLLSGMIAFLGGLITNVVRTARGRARSGGAWVLMLVSVMLGAVGWFGLANEWWMTLHTAGGHAEYPIDAKWSSALSMVAAILVYTAVSLLGPRRQFNLDKMLHRGEWAVAEDRPALQKKAAGGITGKFRKMYGFTAEFTWRDKLVSALLTAKTFLFFGICAVMTPFALWGMISTKGWRYYQEYMLIFNLGVILVIFVWIGIGGILDVKGLFRSLRLATRDARDDGTVEAEEANASSERPASATAEKDGGSAS